MISKEELRNVRVGDTVVAAFGVVAVDPMGRADCHVKVKNRMSEYWVNDADVVEIRQDGFRVGERVLYCESYWTVMAFDEPLVWLKGEISDGYTTAPQRSLARP